jgi:hypothetical protein
VGLVMVSIRFRDNARIIFKFSAIARAMASTLTRNRTRSRIRVSCTAIIRGFVLL